VRRRAAALAGVLVITPLIATAGLSPAVAAAPETVTLGDFGAWTVPAGVTSVTIELTGGDGGTATSSAGVSVQAVGGRGGLVSGSIAVEPGDELFFRVGTAGTGVDIATVPNFDTNPGGTGAGDGGDGWASGGGSTSVLLNGVLVAGAPGAGGGAALMSTQGFPLFVSRGGDGGEAADDVVDGATVLLAGSAAGANPISPTTDGRDANFGSGSSGNVRTSADAPGGGGAGWPGGDSQSVLVTDGPIAFAASGGGGGLPFIGDLLIDPVTGVKDDSAGRDGSATITYVPAVPEVGVDNELAATGPAGVAGAAALAALLLVAGGVAVATGRRATR
jgi:hypothetical protein